MVVSRSSPPESRLIAVPQTDHPLITFQDILRRPHASIELSAGTLLVRLPWIALCAGRTR